MLFATLTNQKSNCFFLFSSWYVLMIWDKAASLVHLQLHTGKSKKIWKSLNSLKIALLLFITRFLLNEPENKNVFQLCHIHTLSTFAKSSTQKRTGLERRIRKEKSIA